MAERLNPGERLNVGDSITSLNGRFRLQLQGDGNLVLYQDGRIPLWSSTTAGRTAETAVMQVDGNFVLYGPGGVVLRGGSNATKVPSDTDGNPGAWIQIQDDGDLVIYRPGAMAIWNTHTFRVVQAILNPDERLNVGYSIASPSGRFRLQLQGDGNLVLYQDGRIPLWCSDTAGRTAETAVMQVDGNFVLYGPGGVVLRGGSGPARVPSDTDGNPGAWIQIQDDGNLVVYNPPADAIWNTHTFLGMMNGAIESKYDTLLGMPTSGEQDIAGVPAGRIMYYKNGAILWTPTSGAASYVRIDAFGVIHPGAPIINISGRTIHTKNEDDGGVTEVKDGGIEPRADGYTINGAVWNVPDGNICFVKDAFAPQCVGIGHLIPGLAPTDVGNTFDVLGFDGIAHPDWKDLCDVARSETPPGGGGGPGDDDDDDDD